MDSETAEAWNKENCVGDIDSDDIGTGARYNSGKPDYSLIILKDMGGPQFKDPVLRECWRNLSDFQLTGDIEFIRVLGDKIMLQLAAKSNLTISEYSGYDSVAHVWEFGKRKYKAWNWAKGMPWSVPFGCAARHLLKMKDDPYKNDEDSGQPHWAHVICNLQMLMLYARVYQEGNDLPYKTWQKKKAAKKMSAAERMYPKESKEGI